MLLKVTKGTEVYILSLPKKSKSIQSEMAAKPFYAGSGVLQIRIFNFISSFE